MRQKEEPADKILPNFPILIQGIITDLRSTIDQLNSNFKRAKESITELARRLDVSKAIAQIKQDQNTTKKNKDIKFWSTLKHFSYELVREGD
jgi:hypothetical protein